MTSPPGAGVRVRPLDAGVAPALCEAILRDLPDWFGIEESLVNYARATARLPTWGAFVPALGDATPAGFITLEQHFPKAAEIHCIAVRRACHGRGVGTAMVRHAEEHFRALGVEFLQVKTMGPSRPNKAYALTTRFYESVGFTRLEELIGFWSGLPALILVKRIAE